MRRTQEQMQSAITEWEQSGLSKKAFCQQRNITYQTFHYWCKRIDTAPSPCFVEIKTALDRLRGCEIIFPSGVRMNFHGEPSVAWLRELVN
ncbi:MAG: hypothetical protein WKF87_04295 [Chryseolinea sp.]